MGISNEAGDFLEAATILAANKPATFKPLYFLVCQSVELSLKAYLRGSGYSERELKGLGHNLNRCLQAAIDRSLQKHVSITQSDLNILERINAYYQSKDLQYGRAGLKYFPDIELLMALGRRLWKDLRPFCVEQRGLHVGTPTEVPDPSVKVL